MKKIYLFLIFVSVLQFSARAEAVSLWLTSDGNGAYTLKGVDFVNVGGVQVVIQYDTNTLKSPNVTKGSLLPATALINPNDTSSTIIIVGTSTNPSNGNGVLATIKFTQIGATAGDVSIKSSDLALPGGVKISHTIMNPADFAAEKAAQEAETARLAAEKAEQEAENAKALAAQDAENKRLAAAAEKAAKDAADLRAMADAAAAAAAQAQAKVAGASVVGGASIGSVTLPTDQLASTDRKTEYQPLVTDLRGDMTIPLSGASTAQAAAAQPTGKEKLQENKSVSYKSVLQLFKEFKGEKSPKGLIALFAEGAVPNFTQDPPVALSDGTTPVRLTLILKPGGNEAPKFILQGASVKQMSSEGEEQVAWTIDALPKKGVYDAKLTVIDGQNIMEFPLVVAPSVGPLVPKAQKFTEADFALYLSKPAKFDLNKDEKFDSIDDYIYTANYIAALKIKPEKLKKDEPVPDQKGDVKTKDSQIKKEDKSDVKTKDSQIKKEDKSK